MEDFNYFEDGIEGTSSDGAFQNSDSAPNTYQTEWDFHADEISALDDGDITVAIASDSVVGLNLGHVYDDGFEFIDQGEYYNEPFVPSDEWSAPVQPNAPPNMFDEPFDFFAVEAAEHDDIFLIVDDDDDAVGPDFAAPVSQFTDDAWQWDEDPQPLTIAVDFQQADAEESRTDDAWNHFDDVLDDDLAPDEVLGASVVVAASTIYSDDTDATFGEEPDEFYADHFGNEDGETAAIDDSFPHFDDQVDDEWFVTGDDDDDAVSTDAVVPASQLFDDIWSWDENTEDDWQTLTDDDDDAISTEGAPTPVEDAFDWSQDSDDDQFLQLDAHALINAPAASIELAFDDAWTWSDELDETSIEDGNAFVDLAQVPAQVFDEPWVWDEETSDEPAIDQQLGANVIVPPSQFTDDAWDWTEFLEVEDQIDQDLEWALVPLLVASHWVVRRRRRRLFTISRRKQRAFEVSAVSSKRFDEKDPTEKVPLTFDFTVDLPDGVVLTSIQSVTFATVYGTDASPNALANGAYGLDATSKKVIVPVQGGLDGRDYNVSVVVLTSESDLVLELNGVLPVRS